MRWGSQRNRSSFLALVVLAASMFGVTSASSGGGDTPWDAPPARRVSGTIPPTDRKFTYNTISDVSNDGRFVIFLTSHLDGPSKLALRKMSTDNLRWPARPRVEPGPKTRYDNDHPFSDWGTASISGNGRYVAFASDSPALVAGDDNRARDVFLYDVRERTVSMVSVDTSGDPANDHSTGAYVSVSGHYVAFTSRATDLTSDDVGPGERVYVRDVEAGETRLASVKSNGVPVGGSYAPTVSNDGTRVSFISSSPKVVPGDTNDVPDAFVHDFATGETTRVSVDEHGGELVAFEYAESCCTYYDGVDEATLSGNGEVAVFTSHANGLVDEDDNNNIDVFAHDLTMHQTERVSEPSGGGDGYSASEAECGTNGECFGFLRSHSPSISSDGRFVYFLSGGSRLVEDERDGRFGSSEDVFLHDRLADTTVLVNRRYDGEPSLDNNFYRGTISFDGDWLTWSSDGRRISGPNDTDPGADVYLQRLP